MKRLIFIFVSFMLACNIQAQEQKDSIVYRYIIAEPVSQLWSKKCKLRIDDGISVEKTKDNGKTITFKSYAAALMFLTSQGWEMVGNYSNIRGAQAGGSGSMATKTYWIFRRPSTKEEVQNIIDKSFEPDETSKAIEDLMKKVYGDK
jgi:hypothetical protein